MMVPSHLLSQPPQTQPGASSMNQQQPQAQPPLLPVQYFNQPPQPQPQLQQSNTQQYQHQHQQYASQEYDYPHNPAPSAGNNRPRQVRYATRHDDDDDDGLREEILMHQIEELTGFLHDEERLKRVRLSKSTNQSPPVSSSSLYASHNNMNNSSLPVGGLFTPQPQSSRHSQSREISSSSNNNINNNYNQRSRGQVTAATPVGQGLTQSALKRSTTPSQRRY